MGTHHIPVEGQRLQQLDLHQELLQLQIIAVAQGFDGHILYAPPYCPVNLPKPASAQ